MLNELVTNQAGVYLLSCVLALGVGLMLDGGSRKEWIGSLLITVVFVLVAFTRVADAPWAGPLYAVVLGVTALLSTVRGYSDSPILADEPYWKKVLLTLAHPGKVRSAAQAKREIELQEKAI